MVVFVYGMFSVRNCFGWYVNVLCNVVGMLNMNEYVLLFLVIMLVMVSWWKCELFIVGFLCYVVVWVIGVLGVV